MTTYSWERYASHKISENVNMTVPFYLMGAYAYYQEDDPIFSDSFFDNLSQKLLKEWYNITHWHKDLITKSDLEAGSYLGEYPERVKGGLRSLRKVRIR